MVQLGLVVAQYDKHGAVIDEMTESARSAAADAGAEIVAELTVPGAYDTPLAADRLARQDDIDAVAVLGAVVTGDTKHDQTIADATAESLQDVGLDHDTPVTFGVSGPGQSGAEARERVDKGGAAVDAAADLVEVLP